jgi:amino acid permease
MVDKWLSSGKDVGERRRRFHLNSQRTQSFGSFISNAAQSLVSKVSKTINIRPGSMEGSILGLIAACLGAGTLTMPCIVSKTGIVLGPILIFAGALLSCYAGLLIIHCTELTGRKTYEEFASLAFGPKCSYIVSVCILVSLLGFATAYVALAKNLIPSTVQNVFGKENLPVVLQNNE